MTNDRKRPIGVTLMALGFLWNGCIGTIALLFALAGKISAIDCALFLVCVGCTVVGFGLWKLKNWARKSVLGLTIFGAIVSAITSFVFAYWKATMIPVMLVLVATLMSYGWLAWYLMRPRVQFAFGAWNCFNPAGEWVDPPDLSKRGKLGVSILAGITVSAFVIALSFAVEAGMRSSGAYQLTMKTAQASPCVMKVLGSPLESHGMITGSVKESSVKGSAELSIPLKGPLGKGNLEVEAKKLNGAWRIDSLIFTHGTSELSLIPIQLNRPCE